METFFIAIALALVAALVHRIACAIHRSHRGSCRSAHWMLGGVVIPVVLLPEGVAISWYLAALCTLAGHSTSVWWVCRNKARPVNDPRPTL